MPLEKLIATKFEGSLSEVTSKGWASASQESTGALLLHDLTETGKHTTVVGGRVKLDPGLDAVRVSVILELELMDNIHIDWSEGTVSHRTAHGTSKSEPRDEIKAFRVLLGGHCDGAEWRTAKEREWKRSRAEEGEAMER